MFQSVSTNTLLLVLVFIMLMYLYSTSPDTPTGPIGPRRENYLNSTVRGVSDDERQEWADDLNARWRTTAAL
jgi:hypothetical protein